MIPDPIIVSIPHTGTRFLKERLGIDAHVHTSTNWDAVYRQARNRQVIAPLRKPTDVWRSWCRRRDDGDPLRWAPHFFSAWYIMHALDMLFDVDFICVDKQDDPRIDDWEPFGGSDQSHAGWKLHRVDLRVLYKLPFVYNNYVWGQK
jgi:hypothetical protein